MRWHVADRPRAETGPEINRLLCESYRVTQLHTSSHYTPGVADGALGPSTPSRRANQIVQMTLVVDKATGGKFSRTTA